MHLLDYARKMRVQKKVQEIIPKHFLETPIEEAKLYSMNPHPYLEKTTTSEQGRTATGFR